MKNWAIILGGSSGMGLASAKKLAKEGMNLCIVHRDRRSALMEINDAFQSMRDLGREVLSFNVDALNAEKRAMILDELGTAIGKEGQVKLLLHTIAKGNLKRMAPIKKGGEDFRSQAKVLELKEPGIVRLYDTSSAPSPNEEPTLGPDDFSITLQAMATSLYEWVSDVFGRSLFAEDARVIGLTSEGSQRAWPNYAAVSAAKAALEAIIRSIALEFGPHGIRANAVQAGVTVTPSLNQIPGSDQLKIGALRRNPMGRLTTPDDVANVIYLLTLDEASWINGALIPVDGGERIA